MTSAILRFILLGAAVAVVASDAVRIDGGEELGWDRGWRVQVDGVMGGRSTGKIEYENNNNVMKFTGDIELEGGGFSSVRRWVDLDLSEYAGVVVTLEAGVGNGATPPSGFHLQFGDNSYYDFSSAFAVPLSNGNDDSPVVTSVYLPMESFDRAGRSGFGCRGTCVLNSSNINRMSVYMLFQDGGFDVRLMSIEAVEEPRTFPLPDYDDFESEDDVVDLIRETIVSGGGLYDKSYMELCIAMYWSVLNTVLSSDSGVVSDPVKTVICAGLEEVEFQMDNGDSKQNIAWTLRYAMDTVMADLKGSSRTTTQDWLPTVSEAASMEVSCIGRTSAAPGLMYDSTNGNILVSDSKDEEGEPPNNSDKEEPLNEIVIGEEEPVIEIVTEEEEPLNEIVIEEEEPVIEIVIEEEEPVIEIVIEEEQPLNEIVAEEEQPLNEIVAEEEQSLNEIVAEEEQPMSGSEEDVAITTAAIQFNELRSGSLALSCRGFESIVFGILLLGVVQLL